jgi:DMSO/TMAO reductase YedYZ molybdopterin-dependent catalytic subunit
MVRPTDTGLTVHTRQTGFRSPLRSTRLSAQLGLWLGIAFGVCFVTGLLSHYIQHPPGWFWWPSRPVWLYRATQGVHVATGLATVPLLGAKLWSVYPRLFTWPPVRSLPHARSLLHAAERGSVAVLVAAALFQLVTGVLNVSRWYTAMPFFFTAAHYVTAWLAIGALLVHVAVQLPAIRAGLSRNRPAEPEEPAPGLSRRGLLATVAASAGAITLATAGQTVPALAPVSVLAPRRPTLGPQRLPVNTSAAAAQVTRLATDPGYRLRITGPAGTRPLTVADLAALPQHTVSLPIACVEGWSADAVWTGVRIADLVALVGVPDGDAQVLVESLQRGSRYAASVLAPTHTRDPLTLLALRLNGEVLALDHGYPARLIAPDRPGVLQTKWVAALTVAPR